MATKHLLPAIQKWKFRAVGITGRLTGHAALYHHSIFPDVKYPARKVRFRLCLN